MRTIDRLAAAIENAEILDAPAEKLSSATEKLGIESPPVRDALSGTWLGHPLHPLLIAVPIGSWVAATVFDLLNQDKVAARRLLGLGIIAAVPTMAAGLNDWRFTTGPERRVGLAHAIGNSVALSFYGASYLSRRRDRHGLGTLLALGGSGAMSVAGWLGGHLSYALGVGVETTAFQGGPDKWTAIAAVDEVKGTQLVEKSLDGVSILLSNVDGQVRAIANRCTHRGGPLSDGVRDADCVRCPWHDSVFDLVDGEVISGPATRPQPAYDVRIVENQIEIKRLSQSGLQANSAGA